MIQQWSEYPKSLEPDRPFWLEAEWDRKIKRNLEQVTPKL